MYGLVLEGGGTKGAYQIGAYEALVHEGIEISAVVGTSIGAINGAMILQGDLELCKKLWENIDYSMVIDMEEAEFEKLSKLSLDKEDILYGLEKIKDLIKEGGLDISPLKLTLDKYIDEEKIRNSKKDFGIVTYNLSNLGARKLFLEDIAQGDLKKYILASAYLPVFKFERLNGNLYIDGAFADNLPFSMLEERGYERLIIIRIYGRGITRKIENENHIVISPREDLGPTLDFNPDRVSYNIRLGYYDTLRTLRGLLGGSYYMEDDLGEDGALDFWSGLEMPRLEEACQLFHLTKPARRAVFEDLIPRLAGYLDLGEDYGYLDVLVGLVDYKLLGLGLERFKVYSLSQALDLARSGRLEKPGEARGLLDRLRERVDLPLVGREEALRELANILLS